MEIGDAISAWVISRTAILHSESFPSDGQVTRVARVQLTSIGPYEVICLLGEGGQGRCYKARHQGGGDSVAIKVIDWEVHPPSAQLQRERIRREIRYLQGKTLTGVVKLLDSGELAPTPDLPRGGGYLVYELIGDGATLRDRLQQRPAPPVSDVAEACTILGQTLASLAEDGVFHRDIKPQNIAFRGPDSWKPVLIDFGIARAIDSTTITSTGKLWGSPYYSPPEWRTPSAKGGVQSVDPRAWDSYSYARTTAVALAVALGLPFEDAEWLSDREILRLVRRHLPRTAMELAAGLHHQPEKRFDLQFVGQYIGECDLDVTIASDLTNRAVVKRPKMLHALLEKRMGIPLRMQPRESGWILHFHPKGAGSAPYLVLGDTLMHPAPAIWFKGSSLGGRSSRSREVRKRFADWARQHASAFRAVGVRHRNQDSVEAVIQRIFRRAREPSAEMAVWWEVALISAAHAYEKLSLRDTTDLNPLLELWKLLLAEKTDELR